jgi:hypothetical protein
MSSYKNSVKPSAPVLQSTRVLDQLLKRIRCMHYSLSTEQVYVYWVRFFFRWSGRGGVMRHPRGIELPGLNGINCVTQYVAFPAH